TGIQGNGIIHDNQVYQNTHDGILGLSSAAIYSNTVYGNLNGIETLGDFTNSTTQYIHNNVVYGNTALGIYLNGSRSNYTTEVTNNTVYQPLGNAVRVENSSTGVHLRNNILWTQSGFDTSVDPTSELGF